MSESEVTTFFPLRRVLGWLLRPVSRLLVRHIPVDDPWEPVTSLLVIVDFGPGSLRRFRWYFEGESVVLVQSVEEVCEWLAQCDYRADEELFSEADFWQHPRTFEHLRKGDCEDHALWAWRKLVELGLNAEFFVGRWIEGGGDEGSRHAWIVFEQDGQRFVLEPVIKDEAAMIRPYGGSDGIRSSFLRGPVVHDAVARRNLLYLKWRGRGRNDQAA